MWKKNTYLATLSVILFLAAAAPASSRVNICWELLEPLWVPPTPLDVVECIEANGPLCFLLPHCCSPFCRLHPECTLGGTFLDGHWDTLQCELMEPEVALEQFLRGHLRPADDFLDPIRRVATVQIEGFMRVATPLPAWIQTLVNNLLESDLLEGQPDFQPGHTARAVLLPARTPSAGIYLPDPTSRAITLDNLIIMRNAPYDALFNEPPRSADDLWCGRTSPAFADAIGLLMHELVHVRQWDVLGRDSFLNNYLLEVLLVGYGNDAFESEAFRLSDVVDAIFDGPTRSADHAWAFNDQPFFTGVRTLTASSNSAGGVNAAQRIGTGEYWLFFGGLASAENGNLQVTAGTSSRYCKARGWYPNGTAGDTRAHIQCFDGGGAPADSAFFATYQELTRMCRGTSYVWSDALTGTFEPSRLYAHNQSIRPPAVRRTAPGSYTVTLPGFGGREPGGHAQVTAYGPDNVDCRIGSWGLWGGTASVRVHCASPDGAPADSRFSVQFSSADVVGRLPGIENAGAYLWADRAASAAYTPSDTYRFNHREGVLTWDSPRVERDSTGRYRALLPGFSAEIERAGLQLSPYGSEDGDCAIVGRGASGSHARVDVACFARSGEPQDRRWVLSLATDQPIPF